MKLEVGEFYLTEDGRIIKITENKQKSIINQCLELNNAHN